MRYFWIVQKFRVYSVWSVYNYYISEGKFPISPTAKTRFEVVRNGHVSQQWESWYCGSQHMFFARWWRKPLLHTANNAKYLVTFWDFYICPRRSVFDLHFLWLSSRCPESHFVYRAVGFGALSLSLVMRYGRCSKCKIQGHHKTRKQAGILGQRMLFWMDSFTICLRAFHKQIEIQR